MSAKCRKYRNRVYTDFSIFSGEAVQRADDICKSFNISNLIGNVLAVIAALLLRAGWRIFSGLGVILSGAGIAYLGSLAGFIALNPITGLILGTFGLGFSVVLWRNRQAYLRIQRVIESYEGDFKDCQPGLDNAAEVELLMGRLVKDILICTEVHWGVMILHHAGLSDHAW